ncbi:hypothetical protein [Novipirellula aureliae]|uniref:hypothetical protein n=1 Tax=Novipirellula aureliae TaxID=2527966 RepID=UPI0011B5B6BD|nr:hypothetical protein [Novipirellula aureliae]
MFEYVGGNPLARRDPSGRAIIDPFEELDREDPFEELDREDPFEEQDREDANDTIRPLRPGPEPVIPPTPAPPPGTSMICQAGAACGLGLCGAVTADLYIPEGSDLVPQKWVCAGVAIVVGRCLIYATGANDSERQRLLDEYFDRIRRIQEAEIAHEQWQRQKEEYEEWERERARGRDRVDEDDFGDFIDDILSGE